LLYHQFRPANNVIRAELAKNRPTWLKSAKRAKGSRALGIRWETQVQNHFLHDQFYTPGPWIVFWTNEDRATRWCQPDGLFFNFAAGLITIVEIKLRHTALSWFQLRQLYQPVVSALFPSSLWKVRIVEVVKEYVPEEKTPEKPLLIRSILTSEWRNEYAVYIPRING
jgi:hypothetical protein